MPAQAEWLYDYHTLAKVTGIPVNTVQQHKTRGHFNPADLESVLVYMLQYGSLGLKQKMVSALLNPRNSASERPGGRPTTAARKKAAKAKKAAPKR